MRYARVVENRIVESPREDGRDAKRLRVLGFVPVDEGEATLPLECASCFEAIFYGFDYDRDADVIRRTLLPFHDARLHLLEWLFRSLSVRESNHPVSLGGKHWMVPLTGMAWFDLFCGVQTRTPTVVYARNGTGGDLLELNPQQAGGLINAARMDYLRAAKTVLAIRDEAMRATTLDDLVELTATLDARLPWVSFTRHTP